MSRHSMAGVIASSGFASGDRLVLGHWPRTPVGPFSDVMWARPDGSRVLLSPDRRSEELITAIYQFDRCDIVPIRARGDGRHAWVTAGDVELEIRARWPRLLVPFRRPAWFTRWVEGPIARAAMGVHPYGVSPTGVRQWYRADAYRPAVAARASLGGVDLGEMAPLDPPLGVGFTDPPRRPSIVVVRPLLEDPSGRLDEIVSRRR